MAMYYEVKQYVDQEGNVNSDGFKVRLEGDELRLEGFMETDSQKLLESMKRHEPIALINGRGHRKELKYEVIGTTIYVNNEPTDY